jgi:hypothetical protein
VASATLLTLALLGAAHGINPAMGWLFAVAIGLQQRSRRALAKSLLPIALGHELSVAATVLAIELTGSAVGQRVVGVAGAAVLIGFGVWKLVSSRGHPRWVGARLGPLELVWWSFLMSSAHGAGLMLLPVVENQGGAAHDPLASGIGALSIEAVGLAAVHTAAMLTVMATVAFTVYEVVGVGFLRRGWINVDRVWAGALVTAGTVTLFS